MKFEIRLLIYRHSLLQFLSYLQKWKPIHYFLLLLFLIFVFYQIYMRFVQFLIQSKFLSVLKEQLPFYVRNLFMIPLPLPPHSSVQMMCLISLADLREYVQDLNLILKGLFQLLNLQTQSTDLLFPDYSFL